MTDSPPPALDLTRLAEVADGDADVIAAILDLYLETAAQALVTLSAAVASGERATVVAASHRLRGASASAGAPLMASLAASLESGARGSEPLTMVSPALHALRVELARVQFAVASALAVAAPANRHDADSVIPPAHPSSP